MKVEKQPKIYGTKSKECGKILKDCVLYASTENSVKDLNLC